MWWNMLAKPLFSLPLCGTPGFYVTAFGKQCLTNAASWQIEFLLTISHISGHNNDFSPVFLTCQVKYPATNVYIQFTILAIFLTATAFNLRNVSDTNNNSWAKTGELEINSGLLMMKLRTHIFITYKILIQNSVTACHGTYLLHGAESFLRS